MHTIDGYAKKLRRDVGAINGHLRDDHEADSIEGYE
jgi:hypothetical protein